MFTKQLRAEGEKTFFLYLPPSICFIAFSAVFLHEELKMPAEHFKKTGPGIFSENLKAPQKKAGTGHVGAPSPPPLFFFLQLLSAPRVSRGTGGPWVWVERSTQDISDWHCWKYKRLLLPEWTLASRA
jgi:hypothetical protein